MRKLFILPVALLFFSCSSSDEGKTGTDSVKKDSVPPAITGLQEIKTDSGTLKANFFEGQKNGEASVTDSSGKVITKGIYLNDQKNGAWVTYDSKGKAIHAEHYGDGIIQRILDPEDFNFDTISNKDLGISFVIPHKWNKVKSDEPKTQLIFEKGDKLPSVGILPTIRVIKVPLEIGDDIHTLAKTQDNSLSMINAHYTPVASDSTTINSFPAFLQYGMYDFTDSGYGFLKAIIVAGNSAYYFDCTAPNYDGDFLLYQGAFEMVVKSFNLLTR